MKRVEGMLKTIDTEFVLAVLLAAIEPKQVFYLSVGPSSACDAEPLRYEQLVDSFDSPFSDALHALHTVAAPARNCHFAFFFLRYKQFFRHLLEIFVADDACIFAADSPVRKYVQFSLWWSPPIRDNIWLKHYVGAFIRVARDTKFISDT